MNLDKRFHFRSHLHIFRHYNKREFNLKNFTAKTHSLQAIVRVKCPRIWLKMRFWCAAGIERGFKHMAWSGIELY